MINQEILGLWMPSLMSFFNFLATFFSLGVLKGFFLSCLLLFCSCVIERAPFWFQDRQFSPERNCQVNVPTGYVRYRTQQHQTLALLFQVFTHLALINQAWAKLLERGAR